VNIRRIFHQTGNETMGGRLMICNNNLCSGVDNYFASSQIKAPKTLHSPALKDRNFVSEQDKNPHEVEALKTNKNKA
jgi:hypothetical protein